MYKTHEPCFCGSRNDSFRKKISGHSPLPTTMISFTVGDYLAERLAALGVKKHFVVPGDYNLTLLDKLNAHHSLSQVGCSNELNCSMAAEGYARAHGVSACVVTYSVGAFSAFNGIGSAYAEGLPVILISGAPNTNDAAESHVMHHTLGESSLTYQVDMARKITCYAAAIKNADEALRMIDEAIGTALQRKRPAYLEIPANIVDVACRMPGPMSGVVRGSSSDPQSLSKATTAAAKFIAEKHKPVIMVGPQSMRADAHDELESFAEAMGCETSFRLCHRQGHFYIIRKRRSS